MSINSVSQEKFHTISVLVSNEVGVLSRIVDLFSGRGYNIESLTVAPTADSIYSRVAWICQPYVHI